MFVLFVRGRVESSIVKVATDLDGAVSQPGQEQKAVSKVKQKARAFLQEMVANISPAFIRYILYTKNLPSVFFQLQSHLFYRPTPAFCSMSSFVLLFRLTGWVLLRLFNGFFWSIQIHKGQLEMVKKAATEVSRNYTYTHYTANRHSNELTGLFVFHILSHFF